MRQAITLVAVALVCGTLAVPAAAQRVSVDYNGTTRRLDLDAYNASVVSVVNTLFARAGGRFEMGDVRGTVTINLRDVTLEGALREVLRRVNAHYDLRRGVYYILPGREGSGGPAWPGTRRDVRIQNQRLSEVARYLSERFDREVRAEGQTRATVSLVLSNVTLEEALNELERVSRLREPIRVVRRGATVVLTTVDGTVEPVNWPSAFRRPVSIAVRDRDLRDVARDLEQRSGVRILVDRSVDRDLRVTLTARGEPLARVLQRLADVYRLRAEVTGQREMVFRDARPGGGGWPGPSETCRSCGYRDLRSEWRYCPMCGMRKP